MSLEILDILMSVARQPPTGTIQTNHSMTQTNRNGWPITRRVELRLHPFAISGAARAKQRQSGLSVRSIFHPRCSECVGRAVLRLPVDEQHPPAGPLHEFGPR